MHEKDNRKSILGGIAWKMGERLLSQGVSFVVSIILARLLSPDDYGLIALVMIFINLANVFITSGFATALIQKKDASAEDFTNIFLCAQLCALILYGLLFVVAPTVADFYKREELTMLLRIFSIQIPLGAYNSIQVAYVSRKMEFKKIFSASLISALVSGSIGVAFAYLGSGVWALVAQSLSATVTNTAVMSVTVPWHPRWRFSKKSTRELMKYGTRVLLADLSGTFFGELRSIIIGKVYTSADLAFYSKGQQIPTMITSNLSNTIMTVMFPALANENDDLQQVKRMAKRSMQVLSYVLVPCMLGLAAVMEPLILLLFTDKWAQTIPYGQVLCIGYCVGVFGVVSLQVLKAIGRSDVVLKLEIWKKPVYLILLIIGVKVDVFAIAVTMAIYDIYGVFINMVQMQKYIHYGLVEQLRDLMPAFALSGIMAAVVLLIPDMGNLVVTLAIKVIAGVAIYVAGSALFHLETFQYLCKMISDMQRKRG